MSQNPQQGPNATVILRSRTHLCPIYSGRSSYIYLKPFHVGQPRRVSYFTVVPTSGPCKSIFYSSTSVMWSFERVRSGTLCHNGTHLNQYTLNPCQDPQGLLIFKSLLPQISTPITPSFTDSTLATEAFLAVPSTHQAYCPTVSDLTISSLECSSSIRA